MFLAEPLVCFELMQHRIEIDGSEVFRMALSEPDLRQDDPGYALGRGTRVGDSVHRLNLRQEWAQRYSLYLS